MIVQEPVVAAPPRQRPAPIAPDAPRTPAVARRAGTLSALITLAKLRISVLALVTTAIGYWLAATGPVQTIPFLLTLLGTALCATGANAANQLMEIARDRRMPRTSSRPLPTGRLSPRAALALVLTSTAAGVACLAAVTPAAAWCGAATVVAYALVYTPLKTMTPWCTTVGAVPGAMPPVIGAVAASGTVDAVSLWLFAILFLWQMPHFYAIAWLYRADYRRGGFPMLSVVDPSGGRTVRQSLVFAVLLLIASVGPTVQGLASPSYAVVAVVLGGAFLTLIARFATRRNEEEARRVFLGSLAYLPALFLALALSWT